MKPYNAIPGLLLKEAEAKILTLEGKLSEIEAKKEYADQKIQQLKKSRANLETQNKDLIRINNELTQELNDLKRENVRCLVSSRKHRSRQSHCNAECHTGSWSTQT